MLAFIGVLIVTLFCVIVSMFMILSAQFFEEFGPIDYGILLICSFYVTCILLLVDLHIPSSIGETFNDPWIGSGLLSTAYLLWLMVRFVQIDPFSWIFQKRK